MNSLILLGIVIILVSLIWLILHYLAKGVRVIVTTTLIILVLLFAAYVWWDYQMLQQGMASQPKFFVFTDNGRLLAGFDVTQGIAMPRQDLTIARVSYGAGDLTQLRGGAFKLIIMGRQSFPNVKNINLSGVTLSKDESIDLIINGSVKAAFTTRYARTHNLSLVALNSDKLVSDANMAGLVFAALVAEQAKAGNIILMTRDGKVTLYPETVTLTMVRTMPEPLVPYFISGGGSGS